MGTRGTRSIFVAALCTGVAMVGLSVHGLMGIDTELAQSAMAARQQQSVEYRSVHMVVTHHGECDRATPASKRI
jgi:hypothetical protein